MPNPLREGQRLAEFRLPTAGGTWVALRQFLGRPLILFLWGSWHPSRTALKDLQAFYEKHSDKLNVVGIAFDVQGVAPVMKTVMKFGVRFPQLLDNYCHLTRLWGVREIPLVLVCDPSGGIVRVGNAPDPKLLDAALTVPALQASSLLKPPPADPRVEILLQHVTNLLGRQKVQEAVDTLKKALSLDPQNKIIADQIDVIQAPSKYLVAS